MEETKKAILSEDAKQKSFDFRLEMIKSEISTIDTIIARMDNITQATKNWAVVIWAGSLSLFLGQEGLRIYLIGTAIIPILFWSIDARWRRLQARSIYRLSKISEFLNSDDFTLSCHHNELINFRILDPTGTQHKPEDSYQKRASMRRTLNYAEVKHFYLGLILFSIMVAIPFLLNSA